MKSINNKTIAFIILLTASFNTYAQETLPVNLETVLKLAGANNLTIQEYKLKYQLALADQSKAKEWWLPNIYAGATSHYLNGAAMNTDGKIFTGLNRNNLWEGLGIVTEMDFGKGIYQSLAARQKATAVNFFSIAERNNITLNAVQTYFDLQAAQLKYRFLQALANQSDTLSLQIKIQVDAGLRYQSEYLLALSNFNHLKIAMLQAKVEWQKKSALLAGLLNLENGVNLISADTSLIPLSFTVQQVDTSDFDRRPEFLGLNAELKSLQILKNTANQGLLLPKLRLGLNNGAFGAYASPLYNTYQLNASLLWNVPLSRLTYKGDLKQWNSKIALQQNKVAQFKNQYQQEIVTATMQIQIAGEQINTAKEALQSSTDALLQSMERQKLGTAKAFEVFQAQQFYVQGQLDYLMSVSEYNKAQYALKVAKGEIL